MFETTVWFLCTPKLTAVVKVVIFFAQVPWSSSEDRFFQVLEVTAL